METHKKYFNYKLEQEHENKNSENDCEDVKIYDEIRIYT